ncbi:hypothetical protein BIV57_05210 [Mangrovactinospora gilvigrisea]|uniref:Uncharacterized protein n=2 Tax=Mangrovactinospora gilvigrisea TaxID=1428644 RepID=A0A1J7BIS1_9ACTN|nr:hypothetical protein BIV57_05210 [Mangrovactinospora gilvigrisea]
MPLSRVEIHSLRYSAACLADAEKEGRRPVPQRLWRRSDCHDFARLSRHDRTIGIIAGYDERRARRRTRLLCQQVGGWHRVGDDLDAFDCPPVRHRHHAVWDAW